MILMPGSLANVSPKVLPTFCRNSSPDRTVTGWTVSARLSFRAEETSISSISSSAALAWYPDETIRPTQSDSCDRLNGKFIFSPIKLKFNKVTNSGRDAPALSTKRCVSEK